MPSVRGQRLGMTEGEVDSFLRQHWLMILGTTNPAGPPHMVTMGYTLRDGLPIFTAYRKSQKAANLGRDPQLSCLIEDIGGEYADVRGVLLYGHAEIVSDPQVIVGYLQDISTHMARFGRPLAPYDSLDPERVAAKRIGVKVHIDKIVSWDHGRLNGAY